MGEHIPGPLRRMADRALGNRHGPDVEAAIKRIAEVHLVPLPLMRDIAEVVIRAAVTDEIRAMQSAKDTSDGQ